MRWRSQDMHVASFGRFWAFWGVFFDISHRFGNGTIFLNDQNGVEVNITGAIGWVGILLQMSGYTSQPSLTTYYIGTHTATYCCMLACW